MKNYINTIESNIKTIIKDTNFDVNNCRSRRIINRRIDKYLKGLKKNNIIYDHKIVSNSWNNLIEIKQKNGCTIDIAIDFDSGDPYYPDRYIGRFTINSKGVSGYMETLKRIEMKEKIKKIKSKITQIQKIKGIKN